MKYIVDTNVPMQAAKRPAEMSVLEAKCAKCCYEFIESFIHNPDSRIVLDSGMEILTEYKKNISTILAPSVASLFLRRVCASVKSMLPDDLVRIEKLKDGSYREFPKHDQLASFDKADQKFIALSNAHKEHPPIVQGTDYKWVNFVDALSEFGIRINFLCEEYIMAQREERKKKRKK